jgi:hypothetical protein
MPVTAKLSKAFYDRLGEEVANELVDWFNLVDATYRADLRELNELNFARFDSRVEQRLVSLEARLNARIDTLEARLSAKLVNRVTEDPIAHVGTSLDLMVAHVTATLDRCLNRQLMLLLGAWGLLMASIVPLWFRG